MRKDELAAAIAAEVGCPKRTAGEMVDAFILTVARAIESGDSVNISGFGSFELKNRKERMGRRTVNGVSMNYPIKACKTPAFTPTKTFKGLFN